jgi:hypothetical protein
MIPALAALAARGAVADELLEDHRPSSAIAHAHYDPIAGVAVIRFHGSSREYRYPCDPSKWLGYISESSAGAAFHDHFA